MNEKIIDLFNKDYSFLVIIIIIMFFILFGLSQNIFLNLFGCNIRFLFKTPIVRHLLVIIMFFLSSISQYAPVAQLDRALDSGSKGHRFKSCRAY